MAFSEQLPYPCLEQHTVNAISFLTDDALASSVGVYAGFTLRTGGVSEAPYDSLNLATHVSDRPDNVHRNRQLLLDALGFPQASVLVPNQVHGTSILTADSLQSKAWEELAAQASEGADGIIVAVAQLAALLCFADCLPAIVASPTGRFAVLHAGWRGALAGIVGKAVAQMQQQDAQAGCCCAASSYNLYVGPHICPHCFEVSAEIAQRFSKTWGCGVLLDERHVSLFRAVRADALQAGLDEHRIVSAQLCTVCNNDQVFSYRASGGVCGRHGAFGIRR